MAKGASNPGKRKLPRNPKAKIKAQIRKLQKTLKLLDKIERQKKQLRRIQRYVDRYTAF